MKFFGSMCLLFGSMLPTELTSVCRAVTTSILLVVHTAIVLTATTRTTSVVDTAAPLQPPRLLKPLSLMLGLMQLLWTNGLLSRSGLLL
jgi:hypothetical protein